MGFVVFAVILGLVVFMKKQAKKTREAWEAAARLLRLRFSWGSFLGKRRLSGRYRGFDVDVTTGNRHGQNGKVTTYSVDFPCRVGGLYLAKKGVLDDLKIAFGSKDIATGDANFDERVIVRAKGAREVVQFLTDVRRRRLIEVFQRHPAMKVMAGEIQLIARGVPTDPEKIVSVLRDLALTARLLTEDGDPFDREGEVQPVTDEPVDEGVVFDALEEGEREPSPMSEILAATPTLEALGDDGTTLVRAEDEDDLEDATVLDDGTADESAGAELDALLASSTAAPPAEGEAPFEDGSPPLGVIPAVTELVRALFADGTTGSEADRLFAESWAGVPIEWSGELYRVQRCTSDVDFGMNVGTKALFDLMRAPSGHSARTVRAVVQLPKELSESLRNQRGKTFTFAGSLLRCDPHARTFYIRDGRITSG